MVVLVFLGGEYSNLIHHRKRDKTHLSNRISISITYIDVQVQVDIGSDKSTKLAGLIISVSFGNMFYGMTLVIFI